MHIIIIGLGGIGSVLSNTISRYLNYHPEIDNVRITLVDGDNYEDRNLERQEFNEIGPKAEVKKIELSYLFRNIEYDYVYDYVTEDSLQNLVYDGDIVLLAVDNHKTRKIVSDHAKQLDNVLLISGGNELLDGNVQIYARKEGKDVTPSLTDYHPEIAEPSDKSPAEMSCEELAQAGEVQLYFTNLSVATLMCWAFYNVVFRSDAQRSEIYFDMAKMVADSKARHTIQ